MRIKLTNVRTINGIRQANSTDSIQTTNISSLADTRAHSRPHLHWMKNLESRHCLLSTIMATRANR
ncbi:hypothetical protein BIFPSEUDO_03299 [Bifidobacterium pseudocatenulatum DSM 20438 = JCM 1200 = LMG 10505]|uniref:Uncharacterized protein n=1 Tax=Bifidobacterium pseudocatenulatum DSM 20438 = JCM 1200 = LMG 10505 TaxID=547043 RepID=C0BRN5_BIFPS|nr:hypothetical protein BIFPSEUDO_03299 [Bifidobacterium pseudocatenulatum DSM 20438 = JCM 1200 = LMG 10505]